MSFLPGQESILNFSDVSYFDKVHQLNLAHISFDLKEESVLMVFGPENSGIKSLVRLSTGQEIPDSGDIYLENRKLETDDDNELENLRSKIGFISKNYSLINNMSVFENIALPMRYHLTLKEDEIKDKIFTMLKRFGLEHRALERPQVLGVSELLRINYMRAIILEPRLVIFDHSMDSVCPLARAKFLEYLKQDLATNKFSVLLATYTPLQFFDPSYYFKMLYNGIEVFNGKGIELFEKENDFTRQYLHDPLVGPMASFQTSLVEEVI